MPSELAAELPDSITIPSLHAWSWRAGLCDYVGAKSFEHEILQWLEDPEYTAGNRVVGPGSIEADPNQEVEEIDRDDIVSVAYKDYYPPSLVTVTPFPVGRSSRGIDTEVSITSVPEFIERYLRRNLDNREAKTWTRHTGKYTRQRKLPEAWQDTFQANAVRIGKLLIQTANGTIGTITHPNKSAQTRTVPVMSTQGRNINSLGALLDVYCGAGERSNEEIRLAARCLSKHIRGRSVTHIGEQARLFENVIAVDFSRLAT